MLLARQFQELGNEVKVITQTLNAEEDDFGFQVVRRPSLGQLSGLTKWCEIFWQNNLSLRTLWPAFLLRKPIVITHQGSYCRRPTGLDPVQRLKHLMVRKFPSVAISQAVADCFANESIIIPNPYDAEVFGPAAEEQGRTHELIFLGRLVSEKGLDLLLKALALLRSRGLSPRLTIVGQGPELARNEQLAQQLGLTRYVTFLGPKRGAALAGLLQRHKILVIPSRYDEPFGIVALEGIACGCIAVGSNGGGLPEAIGRCGLTFPNGDVAALTSVLERLLSQPNEQARLRAHAAEHLARHHPHAIAQAYLSIFRAQIS